MPMYTPPNGNDADFELISYTPPNGNDADFELEAQEQNTSGFLAFM